MSFYNLDESKLTGYKYNGSDLSILRKYVFKPYLFEPIAKLISPKIAPNLITLAGSFFIVFNFACFVYLDVKLKGNRTLSLISAVCLFSYFLLDNLDGIHARNTGNSTPLGQMFDHGIDSIGVPVMILFLCSSLRLEVSLSSFLLISAGQMGFCMPVIEERYSGKFVLGYLNGSNEGVVFVIFAHLFNFFSGESIFDFLLKKFSVDSKKATKGFEIANLITLLLMLTSIIITNRAVVKKPELLKSFFFDMFITTSIFVFSRFILDFSVRGFYLTLAFQIIYFSSQMIQVMNKHMSNEKTYYLFSSLFYPLAVFVRHIYYLRFALACVVIEYLTSVFFLIKEYQEILNISWYKTVN